MVHFTKFEVTFFCQVNNKQEQENKNNSMNNIFHTLMTILLLTFVITVSGVPIRDRFRYSDPDTE